MRTVKSSRNATASRWVIFVQQQRGAPGETIADNYGIWLDPGTPPGDYRLEIGMYRADDRNAVGCLEMAIHLILGILVIK